MSPRRIPIDHPVLTPRPGATHRLHLTASDVSVVLDVTEGRTPAIAHWGAALGELGADGAPEPVVFGQFAGVAATPRVSSPQLRASPRVASSR